MLSVCLFYNGVCLTSFLLLVLYLAPLHKSYESKRHAENKAMLQDMEAEREKYFKIFNATEKKLKKEIDSLRDVLGKAKKLKDSLTKQLRECEITKSSKTKEVLKVEETITAKNQQCKESKLKLTQNVKNLTAAETKTTKEYHDLHVKYNNLDKKCNRTITLLTTDLDKLKEDHEKELNDYDNKTKHQQEVQAETELKLSDCEKKRIEYEKQCKDLTSTLNSEVAKLKKDVESRSAKFDKDLKKCKNSYESKKKSYDSANKAVKSCESNLKTKTNEYNKLYKQTNWYINAVKG